MLPDMGKRADIFSVRNQIDHLLRASPLTARKFPSPLDLWLTGLRIVTECLGLRTVWTEDFGLNAKLWLVEGNSDISHRAWWRQAGGRRTAGPPTPPRRTSSWAWRLTTQFVLTFLFELYLSLAVEIQWNTGCGGCHWLCPDRSEEVGVDTRIHILLLL